jgi:hypothetical protein
MPAFRGVAFKAWQGLQVLLLIYTSHATYKSGSRCREDLWGLMSLEPSKPSSVLTFMDIQKMANAVACTMSGQDVNILD